MGIIGVGALLILRLKFKMADIKIVVASQDPIEIKAVQDAWNQMSPTIGAEMISVNAALNRSKPLMNDEGVIAARFLMTRAKQLDPTGAIHVAIANFTLQRGREFLNRDVVVVSNKAGQAQVSYSDGNAAVFADKIFLISDASALSWEIFLGKIRRMGQRQRA